MLPFENAYAALTGWIFETVLQPLLFAAGQMEWGEDIYAWLDFALLGLVQILLVYAVCRPLEAWKPVEPRAHGKVVRTDVLYTLLTRLGLLPLLAFIAFASLTSLLEAGVADSGFIPPTLESLVPALQQHPLLAFLVYVVVLDFAEYWRHRAQHQFGWWWQLHAIHHAQRHMTFWSDDRNHLLDEVIGAIWFGAVALLIGVPPNQFPLIVMLLRLVESLSHANARLSFGRIGERLLVSPRFHRTHHGVLAEGQHGCNYAVLLPVWDWIFGTADWQRNRFPDTGAPGSPEAIATGGWLRQQLVGLRQMARALAGRPG